MGEQKRKEENKPEFIFGKKNYKFLFIGLAFIAIGIGGTVGLQSFQNSQLKKAENASRLFSEIEFSVKQQRLSQAQTLLQEMDNNFANTPYQDQSHFAAPSSSPRQARAEEAR